MTQVVTTTPAALPAPVQLAVAAWLDEHRARPLTHRAYAAELRRFRAELQRVALDLASPYGLVALVAQAWAASGDVGAVTHNKRLSIISSFYSYGIRHQLLDPPNPIDLVTRRKHAPYARAQALDVGEVRARLAAIDRSTHAGARDYALLSLALATGRRLRELAGLRVAHASTQRRPREAAVAPHQRPRRSGV
jgi:site-specific recombinase XerD